MAQHQITIGCIIMASGRGERFGGNKLLSEIGGEAVIRRVTDAVLAGYRLFEMRRSAGSYSAGVADEAVLPVMAVTRYPDIAELLSCEPVRVVTYPGGPQSETVKVGMESVPDGWDACMFVAGDQPLISALSICRLLEEMNRQLSAGDTSTVIRLSFRGRHGNPVLFPKRYFGALSQLSGDRGGGQLLKDGTIPVRSIPARSASELLDIDIQEDLQKAESLVPLYEKLGISRGITSIIGSGGKTTLLRALSKELPGTVILTTSTHILPFNNIPLIDCALPEYSESQDSSEQLGEDILHELARSRVLCVGTSVQTAPSASGKSKLTAPAISFSSLARCADYVLVEADGSKHLPIKAHEEWEPVVPPESSRTVCVVGASGFMNPVSAVCHRPEVFCRLTGCSMEDPVTPEMAAAAINRESFSDIVYLTQKNALPEHHREELLSRFVRALDVPCIIAETPAEQSG